MLASSCDCLSIKASINRNINQRLCGLRPFFGSGDENKTPRFLTRKRTCDWHHNCVRISGLLYTGRSCKLRANYGHELHIRKQEKNVHINKCPETSNSLVTSDFPAREKFCGCFVYEVRRICLFCQCSLHMRHVSIEKAPSIFTTNTSGPRRIITA
jgi:hypothetical protein